MMTTRIHFHPTSIYYAWHKNVISKEMTSEDFMKFYEMDEWNLRTTLESVEMKVRQLSEERMFKLSTAAPYYDHGALAIKLLGAYTYREFAEITGMDAPRLNRMARGFVRIYLDEYQLMKTVCTNDTPMTKFLPLATARGSTTSQLTQDQLNRPLEGMRIPTSEERKEIAQIRMEREAIESKTERINALHDINKKRANSPAEIKPIQKPETFDVSSVTKVKVPKGPRRHPSDPVYVTRSGYFMDVNNKFALTSEELKEHSDYQDQLEREYIQDSLTRDDGPNNDLNSLV